MMVWNYELGNGCSPMIIYCTLEKDYSSSRKCSASWDLTQSVRLQTTALYTGSTTDTLNNCWIFIWVIASGRKLIPLREMANIQYIGSSFSNVRICCFSKVSVKVSWVFWAFMTVGQTKQETQDMVSVCFGADWTFYYNLDL